MTTDTKERTPVKVTLGEYLHTIRVDRNLTLRQVEEATNKEVSNAYLSQIENNKIHKPSPNILHTLAQLYGIDYENLMEMAGYIAIARNAEDKHGRLATFSELNLTPQEEAEMLRYLKFIRADKSAP
jgi:transcriptional regulator with XRE-family HTH domain